MVLNKSATKTESTLVKPDIYRETGLRYLGYAGSIGWICRGFLPFQMASMVSVAYVCADIFDKANASSNRGDTEEQILKTATDSFIWHFFASFALPSVLIHGISRLTTKFRSPRPKSRSRYFILPCLISGFALPLMSKPMDNMVDNMMNNYFRNLYDDEYDQSKCGQTGDGDFENESSKYNWFFEQSRDQHDLELARYRENLKAQRAPAHSAPNLQDAAPKSERQAQISPAPNNDNDLDGLEDKAVQVDKTTKPRPPKQQ